MGIATIGGTITAVNAAACEILGYAREDLEGMRVADLTPAGHTPLFDERIHALLAGTIGRYRAESTYARRNGDDTDPDDVRQPA